MLGPVLDCGEIDGRPLRCVATLERHLEDCARWLSDPAVTRYLTFQWPRTRAEQEAWLRAVAVEPNAVHWAIEVGDTHIGQCAITEIDWICRTGLTSLLIGDAQYWGRGIAGRVMRARSRFAFQQLNLQAVFTEIYMPNEGSRKAATRAGYVEYGRRPFAGYADGRHLELWMAALSREDWEREQREAAEDPQPHPGLRAQ